MIRRGLLVLVCFALGACAGGRTSVGVSLGEVAPQPSAAELAEAHRREAEIAPVVEALTAGSLERASAKAQAVLQKGGARPEAAAVSALLRWLVAVRELANDVRTVVIGAIATRRINVKYARGSLENAAQTFAAIDAELEKASAARALSLHLCPACWGLDWNQDGAVDQRDRWFAEIELDANGVELAPEDPRRRPTFAFDRGDLHWARAMLSFQRALLEVLLAYRWSDLDPVMGRDREATALTVHLEDAARVRRAGALIQAGLDEGRRARAEFLAETDDDHEWVPNPKQQDHPIPLPVDAQLYAIWEAMMNDLDRLLRGEEGLAANELFSATGEVDTAARVAGFIDVRALFDAPQDLVLDFHAVKDGEGDVQKALEQLLGHAFSTSMKPSPLPTRVARMRREVEAGQESWARKMRYLLWLN